uniref:Uncharacterized protein n=1 Tax=Anguilla anguilla TaxID=7936 RepID=A0A0E9WBY0_ANGAN
MAEKLVLLLILEFGLGIDKLLELLILADHLCFTVKVLLAHGGALHLQCYAINLILDALQFLVYFFELLSQILSLLALWIIEELCRGHKHSL